MNVFRLIAVTGVKEESVWPDPQYRRHAETVLLSIRIVQTSTAFQLDGAMQKRWQDPTGCGDGGRPARITLQELICGRDARGPIISVALQPRPALHRANRSLRASLKCSRRRANQLQASLQNELRVAGRASRLVA